MKSNVPPSQSPNKTVKTDYRGVPRDDPKLRRGSRLPSALGGMSTNFVALNDGWNADPNCPEPTVRERGQDVVLSFRVNAFLYPNFEEGSECSITFKNCWRYRLGGTNDEGWFMGQCRFSRLAPEWGEFYRVDGDLLLEALPMDWRVTMPTSPGSSHYLFYLKDNTFECDATGYEAIYPS